MSRAGRDDRPSVAAILAERKMDSSAVGNHNKVKVMATQLLAKFEENAPAQQTGLKRQVGRSRECLKETRQHSNCVFQPRAIAYFVLRGSPKREYFEKLRVFLPRSSSGLPGDSLGLFERTQLACTLRGMLRLVLAFHL